MTDIQHEFELYKWQIDGYLKQYESSSRKEKVALCVAFFSFGWLAASALWNLHYGTLR